MQLAVSLRFPQALGIHHAWRLLPVLLKWTTNKSMNGSENNQIPFLE